MRGVSPPEGDLPLSEREQSMIGDSHAMSVAAQILKHIFRATEGAFSRKPPSLFGRTIATRQRKSSVGRGEPGFHGSSVGRSGRLASDQQRTYRETLSTAP